MVATKRKKTGDRGQLLERQLGEEIDVMDSAEPDLSANLPESLTIDVSLPATVHDTPEDELAVAIVEVPINPGDVIGRGAPITTSVPVIPDIELTGAVESAAAAATIPALPLARDSAHSRRERLRGEVSSSPESAAMLTADRLIDAKKSKRPRPEGRWSSFVYSTTLHLVNLGDSPAVRARKAVEQRIDKTFEGGTRFVPVLTRKGGVGKTTVTALMGMAMADIREDRVIAIDANPDRGTLAERVNKQTRSTVRDVVTMAASISSFSDFTNMVSRDETRLDILASDTDPLLSEAFDENDYNVVADLCARFYSIA
ncbi:MAG: AAA family ATPase, partial [Lacisediminihabitans sp.]